MSHSPSPPIRRPPPPPSSRLLTPPAPRLLVSALLPVPPPKLPWSCQRISMAPPRSFPWSCRPATHGLPLWCLSWRHSLRLPWCPPKTHGHAIESAWLPLEVSHGHAFPPPRPPPLMVPLVAPFPSPTVSSATPRTKHIEALPTRVPLFRGGPFSQSSVIPSATPIGAPASLYEAIPIGAPMPRPNSVSRLPKGLVMLPRRASVVFTLCLCPAAISNPSCGDRHGPPPSPPNCSPPIIPGDQ
jgi:hypothetical protein